MIKTFTHVKNGKTMYAVTGETDNAMALEAVRKFRKRGKSFTTDHKVCDGTIYKNKLYVGDIDRSSKTPCKIVYRNTIDISEFE